MGETPRFQLPFPEESDPPDGPAQIGALAGRLDGLIVAASAVGQPDGIAGLDSNGRVPAGQLPTDLGGIPATIVDVKGDLIAASGPDQVARLAVGADGQVLSADSGQPTGLRWVAGGGGGNGGAAAPHFGADPPASVDGAEWVLPADPAHGVLWRFRFNAASPSPYKWEFVGGGELVSYIETLEQLTWAVSNWGDLATVGPRIVVPRLGDYHVLAFTGGLHTAVGGGIQYGIAIGATAPVRVASATVPGASYSTAVPGIIGTLTDVAAGADIRLRYWNFTAGSASFMSRSLAVTPVRVS